MKTVLIVALVVILLLVLFTKYSSSGFSSETKYVELVDKMLGENKTTTEILTALQEQGAPMEKIPTYVTMGQMKRASADKKS